MPKEEYPDQGPFFLTYSLRVAKKMGQMRTIQADTFPELMQKLRIEFPYVCDNLIGKEKTK